MGRGNVDNLQADLEDCQRLAERTSNSSIHFDFDFDYDYGCDFDWIY